MKKVIIILLVIAFISCSTYKYGRVSHNGTTTTTTTTVTKTVNTHDAYHEYKKDSTLKVTKKNK